MKTGKRWGAIALLLAATTPAVVAQTTDGYHAIQVFPIVVDSASFTQRFHFRGTDPWGYSAVEPTFYPAQGTVQQVPLTCTAFTPSSLGETSFASLRELCPGLPAGTAFGTLVLRNESGSVFSAYSRVSNVAGAGFTVEAFAANNFTPAFSVVTGLRRLAATAGAPAYQSNCFLGNLADLAPAGTPGANEVFLTVKDRGGQVLGSSTLHVQSGQLIRLLDVFAAANVPAGDVDDAIATFYVWDWPHAALITFCTVQDNTSFSADFRIGKQEVGFDSTPGAYDHGAMRWVSNGHEEPVDGETTGAAFVIPAGASRNIHLFYFRHPDYAACQLQDGAGVPITPAYGLEMRLRTHDLDGWHVIAGGDDVQQFALYLGDKFHHGRGANTSYQLEVESNGQNQGSDRAYTLVCSSGSGSNKGELMRKGLPVSF